MLSLCFNSYLSCEHQQNYQFLARGVERLRLLGGNLILFLSFAFCSCLVTNNSSSLWLDVVFRVLFSYFDESMSSIGGDMNH